MPPFVRMLADLDPVHIRVPKIMSRRPKDLDQLAAESLDYVLRLDPGTSFVELGDTAVLASTVCGALHRIGRPAPRQKQRQGDTVSRRAECATAEAVARRPIASRSPPPLAPIRMTTTWAGPPSTWPMHYRTRSGRYTETNVELLPGK
jgi:hypothetical protein